MADEVQTFKALITIHKVLQEGHPITIKEAQAHTGWVESLNRGVIGEGMRGMPNSFIKPQCRLLNGVGYGPLIREYIYFLRAKLQFHRHHPEFNGLHASWLPREPALNS
jgi:hypothetical protein